MNPTIYGLVFAGGLFLGMLLLLETGRRIAIRRLAQDPEGARQGLSVVEGAVFSLLGLLIAFTFSGAATRFEGRRHLIVEEANDIGTAYLRIHLLPASAQPALRELFRQYLDSRLETYRKLPDLAAAKAELERSLKFQGEIWSNAVEACRDSGSQPAHMLLLPGAQRDVRHHHDSNRGHEKPSAFHHLRHDRRAVAGGSAAGGVMAWPAESCAVGSTSWASPPP